MRIKAAIAAVMAALAVGYAGFQAASGGDDAKPAAKSRSVGAAEAPGVPLGLPRLSIPADNPSTPEKVELGRMLYFDKRVSKDGTIACVTCHDPKTGWAEREPTSTGIDGHVGGRNSPTVINAAYADAQFWDGRAKTLEDQAVGPVGNPIEMGSSMPEVVEKLDKIPGYRERFQKVFGTGVTEKGFARAIAAFERTILSGNSAFDRYMAGDAKALSAAQQRGFEKFRKAGCAGCHTVPLFSDYAYYNAGVDIHKAKPDIGRKEVTKDDDDTGAFRTPSLRDVARTAPYFHDGSAKTLEDAVALMAAGGKDNPHRSTEFNRVRRAKLSDADQKDLVAFLKALDGNAPAVEPPKLPE